MSSVLMLPMAFAWTECSFSQELWSKTEVRLQQIFKGQFAGLIEAKAMYTTSTSIYIYIYIIKLEVNKKYDNILPFTRLHY